MRRIQTMAGCTALAALSMGVAAHADDKEAPGWYDTAELSFVTTSGNAEADTLSFANTLRRLWEKARFKVELGGLRAESTTTSRRAVGTSPDDFEVVESSTTDLTAESYYLRGRYDRDVSERLFWFAGGGWNRNEFAGVRNRYQAVGGVGNVWVDRETTRFRTDYGLSWTRQEDVVEGAGSNDFAGLRLSTDFLRKLTANTTLTHVLVLDENLDDTEDLRIDTTVAVQVAMSERLALKAGLQLLFDNQPALETVPLELPDGGDSGETVQVALDELDSLLTVALVVKM